jgi:predicted RNA-binding protein with PUA-like domain
MVDFVVKSRPRYWLFKSEPDVFSIQDLERAEGQRTCWEGVRNYQARNSLRDDVRIGDQVLYYHSNAEPPHVAGVAEVVREAYPDHFALDEKSPYFDPKSTAEKPTWVMVDIALVEIFKRPIPLATLREVPSLAEMVLLQKGSRLSIQPVTPKEFAAVLKLARKP